MYYLLDKKTTENKAKKKRETPSLGRASNGKIFHIRLVKCPMVRDKLGGL